MWGEREEVSVGQLEGTFGHGWGRDLRLWWSMPMHGEVLTFRAARNPDFLQGCMGVSPYKMFRVALATCYGLWATFPAELGSRFRTKLQSGL